MPHQEENSRVEFAYAIACFIYDQARRFVRDGIGEDLHGNDLGLPGELENIPSDSRTYLWADAMVRFVRYVANVFSQELLNYQERESEELDRILDDISNKEN